MRMTRGDRQEQILLRGAEKLLHERPLSELTMEAVAAEAGMSRSAVYFYFGSKGAIVDTLIERLSEEMFTPFREPPEGQGFAEYLERTMGQVFTSWRQHRPVFQAAIELSTSDADSRVRWRANIKQFADAIARVAERERAQGRLRPEGDLGQCAAAACWMVERSCYMLFSREHSAVEEQQLMDTLTLMLTRGFGAR
jgi:TetR/AcrR family transcriptional regulator, ethionamide resistance regulator